MERAKLKVSSAARTAVGFRQSPTSRSRPRTNSAIVTPQARVGKITPGSIEPISLCKSRKWPCFPRSPTRNPVRPIEPGDQGSHARLRNADPSHVRINALSADLRRHAGQKSGSGKLGGRGSHRSRETPFHRRASVLPAGWGRNGPGLHGNIGTRRPFPGSLRCRWGTCHHRRHLAHVEAIPKICRTQNVCRVLRASCATSALSVGIHDPVSLAAAATVVLGLASLLALAPAARAARAEPLAALRDEI
jgi:hypothetical protein